MVLAILKHNKIPIIFCWPIKQDKDGMWKVNHKKGGANRSTPSWTKLLIEDAQTVIVNSPISVDTIWSVG